MRRASAQTIHTHRQRRDAPRRQRGRTTDRGATGRKDNPHEEAGLSLPGARPGAAYRAAILELRSSRCPRGARKDTRKTSSTLH
ncbi:hypothetical protein NDU88_007353 [Pleurodeles waltl]|uniref:Uncharacterized protein n=1 Tax=Pleurodeles waltl TaxID=8319 RepID=A0AAV7MEY8_PLEWA|nr:hypothetical protein NDU88_007353 [Pleurodeles waltl]